MSKIILNDVTNIDSLSVINDNFDKIEQELQNKVWYRNNPTGEPNGLVTNVDFNGKDLLNVGTIFTADGSAFASANQIYEVQNAVEVDRANVQANKDIVEADKNTTVAAKDTTLAALDSFDDRYLGVKSSDPVLDNDGNSLVQGALYFSDQAPKQMKVYNGSAWQAVATFSTTTTTSIDASLYASQVEAEQGTNNTKVLTPLRTSQAIAANTSVVHRTGDETIAGVKTFSSNPLGINGTLIKVTRYTEGTYTPSFDSRTKFIILDMIGGGGNSGTCVANAAGYYSYGLPGGSGARWKVLLNKEFVGGTLVVGGAAQNTSFTKSGGGKYLQANCGYVGYSSPSFNTFPAIIDGYMETAGSEHSGWVLNTDFFNLDYEAGVIPAVGLASTGSTWCVPSRCPIGRGRSSMVWQDFTINAIDMDFDGGYSGIDFGSGGLGRISRDTNAWTTRDPGEPGVAYLYEYS